MCLRSLIPNLLRADWCQNVILRRSRRICFLQALKADASHSPDCVKTTFMVRLRLTTNGRIFLESKHLSVRPEHGRRAPKEFSHSLSAQHDTPLICGIAA